MTGIGGMRMWMEDFMINSSSYNSDYRRSFIKIKDLWNECVKAFKDCKTIKESNDLTDVYYDKLEDLRNNIYGHYGGGHKVPCGIYDTLDYFEDAIGDLDDKTTQKIADTKLTKVKFPKAETFVPEDIEDIEEQCKRNGAKLVKEGKFYYVVGEYYEVFDTFMEEYDNNRSAVDKVMKNAEFVDKEVGLKDKQNRRC